MLFISFSEFLWIFLAISSLTDFNMKIDMSDVWDLCWDPN